MIGAASGVVRDILTGVVPLVLRRDTPASHAPPAALVLVANQPVLLAMCDSSAVRASAGASKTARRDR